MFFNGNKLLVMKIPSVVVKGDYNYVINPLHQNINKIKLLKSEKFEFDTRFFY